MKMRNIVFLSFFFLLLAGEIIAQPTTKSDSASNDNPKAGGTGKVNVLIIPWAPQMFNGSSDVTRDISKQTGQNYNQIQESLRKGMADQMKKAFSGVYKVTSLLDDTAKMKGDLTYAYTVTTTEYISVSAPLNPPPAQKKDGKNPQTATGIKNGQVQVEQGEGEKFMNTVVLSPNLLSHLKKKYNADYVVFLNQLDLQDDLGADPYNISQSGDYKRSATLHWTIFSTATGKRVAMGKTKSTFANTINTPKKIIDGAFANLSKAVYEKFTTAVKPAK